MFLGQLPLFPETTEKLFFFVCLKFINKSSIFESMCYNAMYSFAVLVAVQTVRST